MAQKSEENYFGIMDLLFLFVSLFYSKCEFFTILHGWAEIYQCLQISKW